MAADKRWRDLQQSRFPELAFDCGNAVDPGIIYSEDLRDWSDKATTPDQRRIEHYIDRFDLRDRRVLHVGVGNSGLAKRFYRRVKEIVGTTIDQPEIEVARALALPNYAVLLHNKYAGGSDAILGQFDFIVDNNLTSPCCCISHLAELFRFLDARLTGDGQIVTDREGLGWVPDDSHPRWGFDFDDLAAVAAAAGLSAHRANRDVFILSRVPPARPGLRPLLRHALRRTRALPRSLGGTTLRQFERVLRLAGRLAR